MNIGLITILYTITIRPLELLFEIIYVLADRIIVNPGIAIIALSIAVNILVLPLYRRADAMQEEERKKEEELRHWVSHIKKTFQGDERFMMLQAYYRQNDYKPTDALKGAFSLLLEIPFFIAAYRFLSELPLIRGVSFGPIADLGAPDGLISLAGISINVLPVLMTAINIVSGAVYTKGAPLKSKIQLYGMALIFLILLYNSPSGLVFYWTLNNLFSLGKNLVYKLKDPGRMVRILCSAAGVFLAGGFLIMSSYSIRSRLFFILVGILLQLPLILGGKKKLILPEKLSGFIHKANNGKTVTRVFLAAVLFLTVLLGLLIPSALIGASPAEFVDMIDPVDPLKYVILSFCLTVGFFVVWAGLYYYLSSDKGRFFFASLLWILAGVSIIDYMFFGTDLGMISTTLKFKQQPEFSMKEYLLNFGILLIAAFLLLLVFLWNSRIVTAIAYAGMAAVLFMGFSNCAGIHKQYGITKDIIEGSGGFPEINLSRNGKNVIVLMMDRMCNYYLPYELYERPELKEKLDGFTYYPNTVSFGIHTNYGVPAVYGGYEYAAPEMNRRDTELLMDKQNEALKLMPLLFLGQDYKVTVCDPTYANYQVVPDLSIYDDYPEIKKYITMGRISSDETETGSFLSNLDRNLFCYSAMKASPLILQPMIYNRGNYNSYMIFEEAEEATGQVVDGVSQAYGVNEAFMASYNVLTSLPGMTHITDSPENTFLMMSNDLTHSECLLQEPEYEVKQEVDNREFDPLTHIKYRDDGTYIDLFPGAGEVYWDYDSYVRTSHYHVNMAALTQLTNWFDYLRENGVYDNTRIIIVSDHGTALYLRDDLVINEDELYEARCDMLAFNCMLLVKDFGSTGFSAENGLMTNADVPSIAMRDLIPDPVNPFTGNPVNASYKENNPSLPLCYSLNWDTSKNNGTRFQPEYWFSVHDNIFEPENWEYLGVQ